jgi:hypothetical protein
MLIKLMLDFPEASWTSQWFPINKFLLEKSSSKVQLHSNRRHCSHPLHPSTSQFFSVLVSAQIVGAELHLIQFASFEYELYSALLLSWTIRLPHYQTLRLQSILPSFLFLFCLISLGCEKVVFCAAPMFQFADGQFHRRKKKESSNHTKPQNFGDYF